MVKLQPLSLARLPTPTEHLTRLSAALGVEVWVKRDDLTGFGLSGNKVRKLDGLLAQAQARGATDLLTTGGLQSNHCRATAVAARRLGLTPHLLLRGTLPDVPDSNLLLDQLLGAQLRTCTAAQYATQRDELLASWATELREAGRVPYVIPEGGSNGLGAMAFVHALTELPHDVAFDHIVCAVGSGGTVAGLALGAPPGVVQGVAVCDDRATFSARVHQIADDARAHGAGPLPAEGVGWQIVEGFQGPAYAVATPEVWRTIRMVAELEGLLLDPVYTGKAMHALVTQARAGRWRGRILFWHTGGAFGLFGRGQELTSP